MIPLIFLGMGAASVLVGAMMLATKSEVAEDFNDLSDSAPVPGGNYTPGTVGCGGLALVAFGIVALVVGVVGALTGGLG